MTTQTIQEQIAALPKMADYEHRPLWGASYMADLQAAKIALLVRVLEEVRPCWFDFTGGKVADIDAVLAAVKP